MLWMKSVIVNRYMQQWLPSTGSSHLKKEQAQLSESETMGLYRRGQLPTKSKTKRQDRRDLSQSQGRWEQMSAEIHLLTLSLCRSLPTRSTPYRQDAKYSVTLTADNITLIPSRILPNGFIRHLYQLSSNNSNNSSHPVAEVRIPRSPFSLLRILL